MLTPITSEVTHNNGKKTQDLYYCDATQHAPPPFYGSSSYPCNDGSQNPDAQGKVGYVSTTEKYITLTSNAKIVAGVNFRPQPTAIGTRIRMLQTGEKMLVLEKVNNAWYRAVDMNGIEGYISTSANYIATNFSVTGLILPLQDQINLVIQAGMKYLSTPYEFGSSRSDTLTFDCSDFVRQAFSRWG